MSREEHAEMLQRLARAASETIVEYDPEAYGLMDEVQVANFARYSQTFSPHWPGR